MKNHFRISVFALCAALLAGTAQADFGDGGKWEMTPYGPRWDENDWPEFTPMYWMEEMANEFDNDDDEDYYRYGGGNGMPYRGWYEDDDNDWPEFTPMYWMEEMANEFDDDDDDYRHGAYGAPYPGWDDDDNDWPEFTPMYWMEEFSDGFDDDDDDWRDRYPRFDRGGFDGMPDPRDFGDRFSNGPDFDMPSMSRPSMNRPSMSRPSMSRPNMRQPSFDMPSMDRPRFDSRNADRGASNRARMPAPQDYAVGADRSRRYSAPSYSPNQNNRYQRPQMRNDSSQRGAYPVPQRYRSEQRSRQQSAQNYAGAMRSQQSRLPNQRAPKPVPGCN